ncbi:MAG TPA: substrate-binding domain-containing protein [Candidatus Hydrogenedentes bacterium]|nr:substrate-binding domain-containing protein [Candidatus Hydrogenedentota bacterium]
MNFLRSLRVTLMLIAGVIVIGGAFVLLKPPAHDSGGGSIIVLCGGSMRGPMEEIVERYKTVSRGTVLTTYGDSGELCAQIKDTGRCDVFVCHDPFMEWAAKQKLIATWSAVGELELATAVPKGNPQQIHTLEDLTKPGLRLGVGNLQYSTSGVIIKHLLNKLPFGEAIRNNIRNETKGHTERCVDVAEGHLDAALTWSAVAKKFQDKLDIIPVPKEQIDAISSATYGISDLKHVKVTVGVTTVSRGKEAVQRFYAYATESCGDIWKKHGFAGGAI